MIKKLFTTLVLGTLMLPGAFAEEEFGLIGEIEETILNQDLSGQQLFTNRSEAERIMFSQSNATGLSAMAIVNTGPMGKPKWNFRKETTVAPHVYMYLYSGKSKYVLSPWIGFYVLNYGTNPLKNVIVEMVLEGPRTSTKKRRVSMPAEKGLVYRTRAKLNTEETGLYTMIGILKDKDGNEIDRVSSKFYIYKLIGY